MSNCRVNFQGQRRNAAARKAVEERLMRGLRVQGEAMKQAEEEAEAYKANQDKLGGVGLDSEFKITRSQRRCIN